SRGGPPPVRAPGRRVGLPPPSARPAGTPPRAGHGSLPPLPGGPGPLPPLHGGPGHIGPADQLPPLHHAGPPNPSAFDPLTHLSGLNSPNASNLANGLRLPDGLQGGSGLASGLRGPDGSVFRAPSLGGPGGLAGVRGLA